MNKTDDRITWSPQGELTIFNAAEAKSDLMQQLAAASYLEVDLSGVEEIDTAGFQLLLMAIREAEARNTSISFSQWSDPVDAALELTGTRQLMEDISMTADHL